MNQPKLRTAFFNNAFNGYVNGIKEEAIEASPIGSVTMFAGQTAPHSWLICNGSEVSQTTYDYLYEVIGNSYGEASEGYFRLPDLRGRVVVGVNPSVIGEGDISIRNLTDTAGEENHQLSVSEMPSHDHNVSGHGLINYNGLNTAGVGLDTTVNEPNLFATPINMTSVGSNNAHNNMQPFIVLNYIIRY